MQKALSFLISLILRVLIVGTIMLWASSQLFILLADSSSSLPGTPDIGFMASSEGLVFAQLREGVAGNSYRFIAADKAPAESSWQAIDQSARSHIGILGFHLWQGTHQANRILGVRYPAALISLLICYWLARRLGRRRRRVIG